MTARQVRVLPKHHATQAGAIYICAECLVRWPCVEAHRAVTRCMVCGQLWSEHTDEEYRRGCRRPRGERRDDER